MGRAAKRESLARMLESHAQTIHETFQIFDHPASSSLEKVDWSQVTKLGDEVSKQATITGMLWSGESPDMRELEESMGVYVNVLQGFLLLCHGSTVGAGPTLFSCIHTSAKQVTERSVSLLRGAISSFGCHDKRGTIPQLSGAVWEACDALKKAPTSNPVAIGRAVAQAAISMKDVLREMRELKPAASDSADESPTDVSKATCETSEVDVIIGDELGSDLSAEEMKIAQLVIAMVSDTLVVIKELIHFLSGLLKRPWSERNSEGHVDSLERLLNYCKEMASQIDELGACVYPPQEILQMKTIAEKMMGCVDGFQTLVRSLEGSADNLNVSLQGLKNSLGSLQSGLVRGNGDLVTEVEKLVL